MKPLKALTGTISHLPDLRLHILLTDEDGVIVARCLDFSVSSHGEDEQDTLIFLSDSMNDYLEHAIDHGSKEHILDPDYDWLWKTSSNLEMNKKKVNLSF